MEEKLECVIFQELQDVLIQIRNELNDFLETVSQAIQAFLEEMRRIWHEIARELTRLQLVAWRIPEKVSRFLAEKMGDGMAGRIGYRYLKRQMNC